MSALLGRVYDEIGESTRTFEIHNEEATPEVDRVVVNFSYYRDDELVAEARADGAPIPTLGAAGELADSMVRFYETVIATRLVEEYGDDRERAVADADEALEALDAQGREKALGIIFGDEPEA